MPLLIGPVAVAVFRFVFLPGSGRGVLRVSEPCQGAPTCARRAGPETSWRRRIPLPVPSPCVAVGGERDSSLGTEVGSTRPLRATMGPSPPTDCSHSRRARSSCGRLIASVSTRAAPARSSPRSGAHTSPPSFLPCPPSPAGSGAPGPEERINRFDRAEEMEAFARAHLTARGERRAGGVMVITACLRSLPHLAAELSILARSPAPATRSPQSPPIPSSAPSPPGSAPSSPPWGHAAFTSPMAASVHPLLPRPVAGGAAVKLHLLLHTPAFPYCLSWPNPVRCLLLFLASGSTDLFFSS